MSTIPAHSVIYPQVAWDNYAVLFSSIVTSIQLAVYKEAILHLKGDVIDCGCGSAKIAPFLVDQDHIYSYTGVDYSPEMVEVARSNLAFYDQPNFSIQQHKIEEIVGTYDSAVSIQSYYAWDEPVKNLTRIYQCLRKGSTFVLATPNPSLNLAELAIELEKELVGHPYLTAYKQYNLELATNTQAHFITMGDLINQLTHVGFKVKEAHQQHFSGGLNFLILEKD